MVTLIRTPEDWIACLHDTTMITIVMFGAAWCDPCQALKHCLDEAVPLYPHCAFALVDIDACKSLATAFDVKSIPHVEFIYQRRRLFNFVGPSAEDVHRAILNCNAMLTVPSSV
jgi:thioredoxin-like negative regulator of GroEL